MLGGERARSQVRGSCVLHDAHRVSGFVAELPAAPAVRNVKTSLALRNSKDAAMVPLELKNDG
ncbi:MAG: hypothetical protein QOH67_4807 [Hyphomicrobiales bacterium]|jgi:hypothetical protein|nr:hypothetical protein [Hyphomicrobiales bacterium]